MNRLNRNPFITLFSVETGDGKGLTFPDKDPRGTDTHPVAETKENTETDTADTPPPPKEEYRSHGTATFSTSPHTPVEQRKP